MAKIFSIVLIVAVVGFTCWQTILLIKDIKRRKASKKQNANSNGDGVDKDGNIDRNN